ncbi:acyl-[acyl-carrier-protein] thioesterase [Sphingobacterium litopenaei]|uniref:Acyl-[acyl-carrier-protein] thioesterase n=1 Tax=Sphingobacterium litopenaei TaxID=2763500 RepID=A0ABR7YIM2_9SPHI|nr:acyl-ACP thioesterase domain-containing protein [Sphingobacterium litopenaei]MBD1431121.1 acyl-[acyl-carrier-protein] thioesterase [Sphingobacterium litopenaei]
MPLSADFKSIHYKNWEVYFSQCYPNGAIKLPELANILQLTAAEHADLGGVGFDDLSKYDQSWVMNRMRIEIGELPNFSQEIEVKTWIEELKGFKSTRNFEVSREGKKLLGISSLWAIFNMKLRRPDALQFDTSYVEQFPDIHATEITNQRVDLSFEVSEIFEQTVQFSDLDIVNHVNNTKYLEWCINYIDPMLILGNKIKAIDLNFIKELSLGEAITIQKGVFDNKIGFKISKGEQICFACVFEIEK